jgi:Streptogramin lyase
MNKGCVNTSVLKPRNFITTWKQRNDTRCNDQPRLTTAAQSSRSRHPGCVKRTAAAILALGWLLLFPMHAMAGVTALTAGNTPQNVVLGQAMTATTITPTGTPYVAQWLGQSYTYEGPAGTGSLAPDFTYSFTSPQDIVQLPNGNYYVLDSGNVRAIDRSTGGVTTLTLPGGLAQGASWGFGKNLGLDGNGNLYLQVDLNTILQLINVTTTPQVGGNDYPIRRTLLL